MYSSCLLRRSSVLSLSYPSCRLFVRQQGVAGWRRDLKSTDHRILAQKRRFESPTVHSMIDLVCILRVGSLSVVDDIRRIFSTKHHHEQSTNGRSRLLATHRIRLTLRQCMFPVLLMNVPWIGYVIAFFILRNPTKYLTPYFWSKEDEIQYAKDNFPMRRVFYTQVVNAVLKSKLIDAKEKRAILRVVKGDVHSADSLVNIISMKMPLSSLPQEHVISLARAWHLWKVLPDLRDNVPAWRNRLQLERHMVLVAQNDTSLCSLGNLSELEKDDVQYCWQMKGFPDCPFDEKLQFLRSSAHHSFLSKDLSVVAHLSIFMALGLASRHEQ
eukprot:scpid48673/ scgid24139/ 